MDLRAEHRGAFADTSSKQKKLFCKPDKCVAGANTKNRPGKRADLLWLGRQAVTGHESKASSLCWRGAEESWTEGCQRGAAEGRLCTVS